MAKVSSNHISVLAGLLITSWSAGGFAQEAGASGSGAKGKQVDNEVKQLSGIAIVGNKEAPKSLYIVPWKSSEVGVETDLSSSLLDGSLQPLDKEVFVRELEFYELSQPD